LKFQLLIINNKLKYQNHCDWYKVFSCSNSNIILLILILSLIGLIIMLLIIIMIIIIMIN